MRVVWFTVAWLATGSCASAQGYVDRLYEAGPAAEQLLRANADAWRHAHTVVKDRVGFIIFQRSFARKNEISQDDMIACIDDVAAKVEPARGVEAMIFECMGSAQHRQ